MHSYIDNILIYFPSAEIYAHHSWQVLKHLQLYTKVKCEFHHSLHV